MRLFKLAFHSALHVDSKGSGEPETSQEFIHSDTLSAALCLAWAHLYPEDGTDLFECPPFQVSSAFPYVGRVPFYPCPVWRIWEEMDITRRKEIKTVRWVSEKVLHEVVRGRPLCLDDVCIAGSLVYSPDEADASPTLKSGRAWEMTERQRVSVDRFGFPQGGQTFFFAMQFFAPDAGLYFLAQGAEEVLQRLTNVAHFLGDTGIGADRNSGLGHFTVSEDTDYTPPEASRKDGWYTLSLVNPGPAEDISQMATGAAYSLLTRSGWVVNSTVGRPPIRVFGEGSYLSSEPKGRVVHMLDPGIRQKYALPINHSAPRDFRAVALPCEQPPYLQEDL
jgi:CRISPR-associated protein Csm4